MAIFSIILLFIGTEVDFLWVGVTHILLCFIVWNAWVLLQCISTSLIMFFLVTCSFVLCCHLASEKDSARDETSGHKLFFAFMVDKLFATANSFFSINFLTQILNLT